MQVIEQNGLPQRYQLSSQLVLSGKILRNGDTTLSRSHLVNEHLSHFQLKKISLPDFQSADGSFSSGHLIEVTFENALFSETVFQDLSFLRVRFINCNFSRAQFENCLFVDCVFESEAPSESAEDIHFHECLFVNCEPKGLGKNTLHNCLLESEPELPAAAVIAPTTPTVATLPEKNAPAPPHAGRFSALER